MSKRTFVSFTLAVMGVGLLVFAVAADWIVAGAPGFGTKQVLLALLGFGVTLAGLAVRLGGRRLILAGMAAAILLSLPGATACLDLDNREAYGYHESCREQDVSSAILKELVVANYPELRDATTNDWTKTILLRQWGHEHIAWGSSCAQLSSDQYRRFFASSAGEIFAFFTRDERAVQCQGAAFALMQLYKAFGFEAYMLGNVIEGAWSHVVTLVRIEYDGRSILAIQDPSLDITYTDSSGAPYDYSELLRALKIHRHDLIRIEQGNAGPPPFIICPEDGIYADGRYLEGEIELPNGGIKGRWDQPYFNYVQYYRPMIIAALEKDNYPPNDAYQFLYLRYIRSEYDADTGVFLSVVDLEGLARSILQD